MLDLNYFFTGTLITELIALVLLKYSSLLSTQLHTWYSKFGIMALLADILIILIGFIVAKSIYTRLYGTEFVLWKFAIILVLVQIVHDFLFYFLIIKPVERSQNDMIDVYKDYADESGSKIVLGDSIIMLSSLMFAILIQQYLPDFNTELGIIVAYIIIYLIYNKRKE